MTSLPSHNRDPSLDFVRAQRGCVVVHCISSTLTCLHQLPCQEEAAEQPQLHS